MSKNPSRHWHSSRDANEPEIIKELERNGAWVIKLSSTVTSGLADLLVVFNKHCMFLEVKMPGEKLRPLQVEFRQKCLDMGTRYQVIDHIDDVSYVLGLLK